LWKKKGPLVNTDSSDSQPSKRGGETQCRYEKRKAWKEEKNLKIQAGKSALPGWGEGERKNGEGARL